MGLFKPGYQSSFYFRRKRWIRKVNAYTPENQKIIISLAKNDEWPEVRAEALKRIGNQEDLAWIAINDEINGRLALSLLVDEKLIAKIAGKAVDSLARMDAIERISDKKTLIDLMVKEKDGDIRKFIVDKINDPALVAQAVQEVKEANQKLKEKEKQKKINDLLEIVKSDKYSESRVAYKEISNQINQEVLLDIVLNAKQEDIRKDAVEKITDIDKLKFLRKNGDIFNIRQSARTKLNLELDQDDWIDRAQYAPENLARSYAIGQLDKEKNQELLAELTKTEKDDGVLKAIIYKLDVNRWQDLLCSIATNKEFSDWVRCDAIMKLLDKKTLELIAKNDSSVKVRQAAFQKLGSGDSADALLDIAKNSKVTAERIAAIEKIDNQNVLSEIILNTNDYDVRIKALEKLTNEELLEPVAFIPVKFKKELDIRLIAIKKITNEDILVRIAKKQEFEETGLAAAWRIKDLDKLFEVAKFNNYTYMKEYTENCLINSSNPEVLQYLTRHATSFSERYNAYCKLGKSDCSEAVFLKSCLDSSKTCQSCKKPVPMTSKAGGNCPHCGVHWTKENEKFV